MGVRRRGLRHMLLIHVAVVKCRPAPRLLINGPNAGVEDTKRRRNRVDLMSSLVHREANQLRGQSKKSRLTM